MIIVIDGRDALLERVGVAVYAKNVIQRIIDLSEVDTEIIIIGWENSKSPFISTKSFKYLAIAPKFNANIITKIKWYYNLPSILKKLNACVFFGNITRLPFASIYPCPVVVTAHDAASISTTNLVGTSFSRLINKYFVKGWVNSATHIICISKYCRTEFTSIFGNKFYEKSSVIYHGLPDDFNSSADTAKDIQAIKYKYKINGKYLFTLGTVTPKKNYGRLIQAFDLINFKDLHLVIAGNLSFSSNEIINEKNNIKKGNNIRFLGSIPTEDVYTLMRHSEAFVFPSLYEGFGIPLLESFFLKIPVACSDATCLPEIAGDGAIFFDPYSIDDMAKAIERILTDTALRKQLVELGSVRLNNFSWDLSAEKHLSLLKSIVY